MRGYHDSLLVSSDELIGREIKGLSQGSLPKDRYVGAKISLFGIVKQIIRYMVNMLLMRIVPLLFVKRFCIDTILWSV